MESGRGATLRESFLASDIEASSNTTTTTTNIGPTSLAGLTLAAVLNNERASPIGHDHSHNQNRSNNNHIVRTLLDIIRNEETLGNPNSHFAGKKSWRSFRDRLNLKRLTTGAHWTSSFPVPRSDIEVPGFRMMSRNTMRNSLRSNSMQRAGSFNAGHTIESVPLDEMVMRDNVEDNELRGAGSGSMRLSASLAAERAETRRRLSREVVQDEDMEEETTHGETEVGEDEGDDEGDEPEGVAPAAQPPMRMSLMDLLEETDRQAGIEGPTYRLDDEEDEEEEEEKEEEVEELKGGGGLGKGEYSCCVCMVRHKGAAFIPCGHTFCRLCSRELWVQRGNCPLCNRFILEVLDIF